MEAIQGSKATDSKGQSSEHTVAPAIWYDCGRLSDVFSTEADQRQMSTGYVSNADHEYASRVISGRERSLLYYTDRHAAVWAFILEQPCQTTQRKVQYGCLSDENH